MKKCCFILPYFGKFPTNFQIFLNSCKLNSDFNWLIFTDDYTEYAYPENVKVEYMEFDELKSLIRSKFDFEVSIEKPYKLCDYKPAYGYMFEDYIKDFRFWGHCDCDLIWGKLNHFIKDSMLEEYDKLFVLGHCCLYKNTHNVNRAFMKSYMGRERYKEVFTHDISCTFDEEYLPDNINFIFEEHGYNVLKEDYSANLCRKITDFRLIRFDKVSKNYLTESKNNNFFVYDNGVLKRYYKRFGKLVESEYMYIHFQSREMKNKLSDDNLLKYKIAANVLIDLEVNEVTEENFGNIKQIYPNNHKRKIMLGEYRFWKNKIINKLLRK